MAGELKSLYDNHISTGEDFLLMVTPMWEVYGSKGDYGKNKPQFGYNPCMYLGHIINI